LGAQALSKEQLKKQGNTVDKRQFAVTQSFEASSVGKNFKPIDEKLEVKQAIEVGTKVMIISGSHKGLEGKILALSKKRVSDHGMSKTLENRDDEIDPDSYVTVELRAGGSKVEIRRKRL